MPDKGIKIIILLIPFGQVGIILNDYSNWQRSCPIFVVNVQDQDIEAA